MEIYNNLQCIINTQAHTDKHTYTHRRQREKDMNIKRRKQEVLSA